MIPKLLHSYQRDSEHLNTILNEGVLGALVPESAHLEVDITMEVEIEPYSQRFNYSVTCD